MNVIINSEPTESRQQTVTFSDQNQQWVSGIKSNRDDVFKSVDKGDALLEDFFSRPIRVATLDWDVGTQLPFTTINPWQAFFENRRIINRISNFKNVRCDLKVKIVINGNGFHYGRALASYRPLHTVDEFPVWRNLVPASVIQASQRLHVWLDPTKSQGGTLSLPFVWNKNNLDIPLEEWREMGEIDIGSLTALSHANNGTDQVAISIFVWAENVEMSMPTASEPGALIPQAGDMDEYTGSGPISGPATAISKVAGALEHIPGIAPYATATRTAADLAAGVSKAMGLSRPVDDSGIATYKPAYAGNMANTNVVDTSTKLSYDVKQELTIDPSAVGLSNEDEMRLSSIAQKESYLTQFTWDRTDDSDDYLWSSYVTPMLLDSTAVDPREIFLSPMAYAAAPFKQWRGTIRYRFQIVASQFHKGRIKVVYDPHYDTTTEYNVQYTQVIDLANARDFTVDIEWGQPFSFLDVPPVDPTLILYDNGSLPGPRTRDTNGVISVYAVNSLTSPSDSNDPVQILVSVSAGPDFEVVNPTSSNIKALSFYSNQNEAALANMNSKVELGGYDHAASPENLQWYSRLQSEPEQYIAMEPEPGSVNQMRLFPSGDLKTWPPDEDKLEHQFGDFKCKCQKEMVDMGDVLFCWSCYTCQIKDESLLVVQGGELDNADTDLTQNETAPESVESKVKMGTPIKQDHTYLVYYGDPIDSIRCLLKRYNPHSIWPYTGAVGNQAGHYQYDVSNFPFNRGYGGAEAMHLANVPVDPTPYSFAVMTFLNWFTPSFLTRRGGLRWKYVWQDPEDKGGIFTVNRVPNTSTLGSAYRKTIAGVNSQRVQNGMRAFPPDASSGHHVTHTSFNPSLEVEFPLFTNFRYIPARRRGWKTASDYLQQHRIIIPGGDETSQAYVMSYCAVGEDFSLGWFQCTPSVWITPSPTGSTA